MKFVSRTFGRLIASMVICAVVSGMAAAQDSFAYQPVAASNLLVPQRLLPLAHAAEVQAELTITSTNIGEFEAGLREIDSVWWPARLLPMEQQRAAIAKLEGKLRQLVTRVAGGSALDRLHQLELQAQAIRVLARPDVQQILKLDKQQQTRIVELFQTTDKLASELNPLKPDDSLQRELQASVKAEMTECIGLLSPEQKQRLQTLFGKEFPTAELQRIYPLAPDFLDAEKQLGVGKTNWSQFKGKVVLVHFYAYECHNCQANFSHYNRWNEKLKSKGVEVIGIQTPETSNESVPENIIRAAKKDGFRFPVVLDLDRKNWSAWGNTMWPTVYVIDKNGYVRFWWQGELNYNGATGDAKIEALVDKLLSES